MRPGPLKNYTPTEEVDIIWKIKLKKLLHMQHKEIQIMKEKLRDMLNRMRISNICQAGFLEENNENEKEGIFVETMTESLQNWIWR